MQTSSVKDSAMDGGWNRVGSDVIANSGDGMEMGDASSQNSTTC